MDRASFEIIGAVEDIMSTSDGALVLCVATVERAKDPKGQWLDLCYHQGVYVTDPVSIARIERLVGVGTRVRATGRIVPVAEGRRPTARRVLTLTLDTTGALEVLDNPRELAV